MPGAIRQIFGFENPTSTAGLGGCSETPPQLRMVATTLTPTLSGSGLLVIASIANLVGNTIIKSADPHNGDYPIIDQLNNSSQGLSTQVAYIPNAASIGAGFNGTTTGGSTTTLVCTGAGWSTDQWAGQAFLEYAQCHTATVASNTSDTLTFSALGSAVPSGSPFFVGDYMRTVVSNNDDFNVITVLEITGLTAAAPAAHSATQADYSAGTNNVTSGSANPGVGNFFVVGFGINDVDNGSAPFVPTAGAGNTDDGTKWSYTITSGPIMRIQHRRVTTPGSIAMLFNAQNADHFQAFMVALPEVSGEPIHVVSRRNQMFVDESLTLT